MLTFLSGRLALWARGEGRPRPNPDYVEGSSPAGTRWYKYDGEQWLYSPAETGDDWQTIDDRATAAGLATTDGTPPVGMAVDLSTPEAAQNAAREVAAVAQDILAATLNEAGAPGVPAERLKQLALDALKDAGHEQSLAT
jgi:hypothetical protein